MFNILYIIQGVPKKIKPEQVILLLLVSFFIGHPVSKNAIKILNFKIFEIALQVVIILQSYIKIIISKSF